MVGQKKHEATALKENRDSALLLGESARSILLMLDDRCLSPCYSFRSDNRATCSMSPQTLDRVVTWASQLRPVPPGILYLVGAPQSLDPAVQEILPTVAAGVICPPLDPRSQGDVGLPYANTQTLVFSCLKEFEDNCEKAMGRSCIIHIECDEIPRVSSIMQGNKGLSLLESSLQFRPKALQRWSCDQLQHYKDQLLEVEEFKFRLQTAGLKTTKWQLAPAARCLALEFLVTIGPDGLCYPCPAFYHAGHIYHGLGALEDLGGDTLFTRRPNRTCRLCQSTTCEACLFCETGLAGETKNYCELVKGMDENTSRAQIIKHKDRSAYLFEHLASRRPVDMDQDRVEDNDSLSTDCELLDDITYDDFTNSLGWIHRAIRAVMKGETGAVEKGISACDEVIESTPKTTKEKYAFEHFTQDLESIMNPKAEALRVKESSAEAFDQLLDKYSTDTRLLSRKHEFYASVKDVLAGIGAIRATLGANRATLSDIMSDTHSLRPGDDPQKNDTVELSAQEVATIQRLYQICLGWEAVAESMRRGREDGFSGLEEGVQTAETEYLKARKAMAQWFRETMDEHGWEPRTGWGLTIDFDTHVRVSHARYIKRPQMSPSQPLGEYSPIMPLDGIELEVYERLGLLVEEGVTTVRERWNCGVAGVEVDPKPEVEEAVCELGARVLDLKRWFAGMAIEHSWPREMHFRVHQDRKMVEARAGA